MNVKITVDSFADNNIHIGHIGHATNKTLITRKQLVRVRSHDDAVNRGLTVVAGSFVLRWCRGDDNYAKILLHVLFVSLGTLGRVDATSLWHHFVCRTLTTFRIKKDLKKKGLSRRQVFIEQVNFLTQTRQSLEFVEVLLLKRIEIHFYSFHSSWSISPRNETGKWCE